MSSPRTALALPSRLCFTLLGATLVCSCSQSSIGPLPPVGSRTCTKEAPAGEVCETVCYVEESATQTVPEGCEAYCVLPDAGGGSQAPCYGVDGGLFTDCARDVQPDGGALVLC
jgi:hypothetical protein